MLIMECPSEDERTRLSEEWNQKISAAWTLHRTNRTVETKRAYLAVLREFSDVIMGRTKAS
jgi:hypothetical protein